MHVLTRDEVAKLTDLDQTKFELAQYADLLRASQAIIAKLETRVKDLSAKVEAGEQETFFTKEQIAELQRRMFGRSSERSTGDDLGPLFDAAKAAAAAAVGTTGDEYETVRRKKRTKFGRRAQPELPRVEIVHTLPEDEAKAEGLRKWDGQFEVSEVVSVIPTKFVLEIHKRQKYLATGDRDADLPAIVTAPLPPALKLKEGSRYSLDFSIEAALSKYLWHLPLERQVRMMAAQGLAIDSQTLFSQIDTVSWYLETQVMPGIVAEIHRSRVKLADETTWKNLGPPDADTAHKRRPFYLWAVRNHRAVCFSVYDARSGKIAQQFLKGIEGVLVVDGFKAYNALAGPKLIVARDWAHARRKFKVSHKSDAETSNWFLSRIDALFRIEREAKGKSLSEIQGLRDEKSRRIVAEIRAKAAELSPRMLPRSAIGKAVKYLEEYWLGLTVFLSDAEVPLHTNTIEGAIRSPVVGRKNHAGSKNLKTAKVAAVLYSVMATCQASGVDPKRYLHVALTAILLKQRPPMPWELAAELEPPSPGLRTAPHADAPALAVSQ